MTPLSPEPFGTFPARWWRSIALIVSILLIAGAVYVAGQDSAAAARDGAKRAALALCVSQTQSRVEGNARYYVLRDFILAAARAREDSAAIATDPIERRIDQHAAQNYRDLLTRIHPLPIPNCSRLIP